MPASTLPLTGKCYYCGRKTPNRFCNPYCGDMYRYRKTHPVVWQKASTRKRKGERKAGGTIDERIDRIVEEAIRAGTCYARATRAEVRR